MIHLITGGSGSGKSEYAEDMLCRYRKNEEERLVYIATMYPYGEETKKKISRHRQMRAGRGFETMECYTDLECAARLLGKYEFVSVLIECISNLVSNEMYPFVSAEGDVSGESGFIVPVAEDDVPEELAVVASDKSGHGVSAADGAAEELSERISARHAADGIADKVLRGIEAVREVVGNVVIVTNEVNSEGLGYSPEMIRYKQVMGEVNRRLAQMADRVTEVVYGIAVEVKDRLCE